MNKLLSANFTRLRKSRIFWLCVSAAFLVSVINMLNGCRQALSGAMTGTAYTLDDYYFNLAPMLGLLWAVFSSLFIGTEYSDGVIRNKLIVGHTRTAVYLSNYIVSLVSAFSITVAWLFGGLAGIHTLGLWQMGLEGVVQYILVFLLSAAAFSSIFTFCEMLLSNKAVSAVLAILLFLVLLMLGSMLYNALCEPDMVSGCIVSENGVQMTEPEPNPDYVGGAKRAIFEFLIDFLPTGQGILIANKELAHPMRMVLSSMVIVFATIFGGVFLFRKKDLK